MIISPLLLVATLLVAIIWTASIIYSRRHLYAAAWNVKGPRYVPFFGCSLDFLKDPWDFLRILNGYFEETPGFFVVWFGSQQIWGINRPDYLETVLNSPNCHSKMRYMYKSLTYILGQGLISGEDVSHWKRHRKIINPSLNQKILNGYMDVFVQNASILMEKLKKFDGQGEFNIEDAIYKCNLDMVCESMMGVKVHAQTTDSTYHRVFESLLDVALLRMVNIAYHMDWFFNRTKLHLENQQNLRVLHDFTNNVIRAKKEEHENKYKQHTARAKISSEDYVKGKALSDLLIEEESFTETEIKDEVITFIMAGSDTSTGTIGFTLLMLGMHPEIQDKVLEEILSVVGPDRTIQAEDLSHLKYLEYCIKETLRLFPSVSFIFREVEDDVKLDDERTLPKGTGILIGIMALHRSATYWPDPLRFDPDRFLPENVAERQAYSYLPFSGGPRNCIGQRFAFMAMKTMLVSIVRRYKVTTNYKTVGDVELKASIGLHTKNGVKISLQHR